MAPPLLFDIAEIDLAQQQYGPNDIEQVNPHRGDMRMLDGFVWIDDTASRAVAFKDVGADEFWVPGHIPGRPLFPGVLMLEAAAQMASFLCMKRLGKQGFLAFTGVDEVRFRGQVVPGNRLYLLAKEVSFKPRRFVCDTQGLVDGNLVFEAQIRGMPI